MRFNYPLQKQITYTISLFIFCLLYFSESVSFSFFATLSSSHSATIINAVISSDSIFFVTAASQTHVKIWDYSTLTLIATLTYSDVVTNVNIDPSNNKIFISLNVGTISVVDPSTFTQITNYAYGTSGYSNMIIFEPNQRIYYSAGFDSGFAPIVHVMDPTRLTQNSQFSTSFNLNQQILHMDLLYDSVNNYNLLAVISDQSVSPYLAVFNINFGSQLDFTQAAGILNSVKFSPTGKYMFSTAMDNILRVYQLDTSRGIGYNYLTDYDTSTYGIPTAITSTSDSYVNVAVGMNILMFQIVNDQLQMILVYSASMSSTISCLKELNSMLFVGFADGKVNLVTVSYSSSQNFSNNSNQTVIIIAVVVPVVVVMLIVSFCVWFLIFRKKKQQKQQNQLTHQQINNLNDSVNLANNKENRMTSQLFQTKNIPSIQQLGEEPSSSIVQIRSIQKRTHLKSSSQSHLQLSDSLIINDYRTIQFQQNQTSPQNTGKIKEQIQRQRQRQVPIQSTITIVDMDQ